MESFSGMPGFPAGRTQQMPQGPGMYGSSPMSPTRAEAGCAGVPVPPSTPSTVSRQVPNAGDVSFSVGPTVQEDVRSKTMLTTPEVSWQVVPMWHRGLAVRTL